MFAAFRYLWATFALAFVAPAVQAELFFAEPAVKLGEIRGGAPLQHTFAFGNTGKQTVEILEVNRGCGCLAPRLEKRFLEPGEKALLVMEVRTLGQPNGPHAWNATVRYRDGDVVRETPLVLHAEVKNEVTVTPAVLALFVETSLRQEVIVTDLRAQPFTVTNAAASTTAIKVQTQPGAKGITKIVLEAGAEGIAPGRHDLTLDIHTSDPVYAHLQVPITLVRTPRSEVLVTPEKVVFDLASKEKNPAAIVRLRPRGQQALAIDKVETANQAVSCTWAAGPGTGATLRVQVNAERLEGPKLDTSVRVFLRDPAGGPVVVPVEIRGK